MIRENLFQEEDMYKNSIKCLFLLILLLPFQIKAQSRTTLNPIPEAIENEPQITVCSQNLESYGTFTETRIRLGNISQYEYEDKEKALVDRFSNVDCDIIALQEILGKTDQKASEALNRLIKVLNKKTGRVFKSISFGGPDPALRVGYLYALDKVEMLGSTSYGKIELPRISINQKPRNFSRGPLEVQFRTKAGENKKILTLINIHFKSKRGGAEDPAQLDWETHRMEMAEALRRIVEERHKGALQSAESILMVLGDRNSNFDVASAKILEGVLTLNDFQREGACRLNKTGAPLCRAQVSKAADLFSVLLTDPETKLIPGTFLYKKNYSWLDDILMPSPSLRYAQLKPDVANNYDTGVVFKPEEASDHAMVWVKLRWPKM